MAATNPSARAPTTPPAPTCHQEQFNSFATVNYDSGAKIEKATARGVSPLFDKLMAPHGFTREHNEPRSHVFMNLDHLIVDRAYGRPLPAQGLDLHH